MGMRRKNNLLLARIIQWISGVLAIIVIYPVFRLFYPCWRSMKTALNPPESDEHIPAASSRPRYDSSGKPITQGK